MWLKVKIKPDEKFMKKYVGKKCKVYQKGCPCCDGWKEYETTGHLTTLVDNAQLCKQLKKGKV